METDMKIKIQAIIDWKKNNTWGYNPHVTMAIEAYGTTVMYETVKAKVSGCGYDKLSAAFAGALNKSQVIVEFLLGTPLFPHDAVCEEQYNFKDNGIGIETIFDFFRRLGMEVVHINLSDALAEAIYIYNEQVYN